MIRDPRPLLPAALLALFGAWSGALVPGAGGWAAWVGHLALAAAILWAEVRGIDPLCLGAWGRWLPGLLWVSIALSVIASPVPRAGRLPLLLFPALLLVPAIVARCWGDEESRRRGLLALAAVAAASAAWALLDLARPGVEKAAAPLGHHLLLATWLAALLPLAAVAGRRPGKERLLGWGAAGLCAVALVATRSISGLAGLAVALWWLAPGRRARGLLLAGAAVAAALGRDRLLAVATAADPSFRARVGYWQGGLEGLIQRPWWGWGAGSVPWTVSEHLRPIPGVNPPGEVVGDLHSLPLHLAYELGSVGVGLAVLLVALLVRSSWRRSSEAGDRALAAAALASLAAAGTSLAAGVTLGTLGPWLVLGVAAGALLAAAPGGPEGRRARPLARGWWPVLAIVGVAAALPTDLAHLLYDRARAKAREGETEAALWSLDRALALDPSFPLYRARRAELLEDPRRAAATALEGASRARAVPVLWLAAGARGLEVGEGWAAEALARACVLDPLGPLPPFLLLTARPETAEAALLGARGLLAEPGLAAATWWQESPRLLEETIEQLKGWPGVDPGWREAAAALGALPVGGPTSRLVLEADTEPEAYTFSLFAFRRRPWPAEVAAVQAWSAGLDAVDLPPASALATTRADAFSAACRELLTAEAPQS